MDTAPGLLTSYFQLQKVVSKTASTGPAFSIWPNIIFCASLLVSEMPPAGSSQTPHHGKDCPLWIFDTDLSSLGVQLVPAMNHIISHSENIYERLFVVAWSICLTV